ncbi:hypothetical protein [Shewanella glacialipiscicola]|uniref:hypothetical protein n=1 Tax=Shewanella glacialipiscicola TaxID=614069 RepID=UPI003D7A31FF
MSVILNKYWVLDQTTCKVEEGVLATDPQDAIKSLYSCEVKETGPTKFDFSTRASNDNGYQYWVRV